MQRTLRAMVEWLAPRRVAFALVGGLAVSIRAEVRFTRDVDLALAVTEDELTSLVRDLRAAGYHLHSVLEHEIAGRTATVRLVERGSVHVDLIVASCGIEPEIVASAPLVELRGVGTLPVATAEDLLAMKVLSMNEHRRRDLDDSIQLVLTNPNLDLEHVRARLSLVTARGFDRGQELQSKLAGVLVKAEADRTSR